ncbi:DUF1684 domain-containing protein [Microbacterium sp. LTA6]|uniref:DUF1684 domain-containing protein n=1 Tax=Microbacterium sp. LTA6 TaxID=3129771 RepID=UPI00324410D1
MTSAPGRTDLDAERESRWRSVSGEYGIASLRHTHWLDAEHRSYPGAPGSWAGRDGRVVGIVPLDPDAEPEEVALSPGEDARVGKLRLRAIDRDGALALRVFDPDAPSRSELREILSFPPNDDWVVDGVFIPAASGETRVVRSVDGYEREETAVGEIALEVGGESVRLTVSGGSTGFSAVIADATSGDDAYRFRFLPIGAPDSDGTVVVDFNRAYLPPCAFSDQYVCPLPPAGNRLRVRVEAGERIVDRAA